jgi:putative phosphoribosyl transferase
VVFSTGSTRDSPRYRLISRALHKVGLATLRCERMTSSESGNRAMHRPIDARVLTSRIQTVIRCISTHPATRDLHRGLYAAGDGAEAGLMAVAGVEDLVEAVVVRAGRLDTVPPLTLASVRSPLLLLVGSRDENVLSANCAALAHLETADLVVVPGATDLFGEPGALEAVGRLAAEWFKRWLERAAAHGPPHPLHVTQDPTVAWPGIEQ